MKQPEVMTFDGFAAKYCETQMQTPAGLRAVLKDQVNRWHPIGFMLLRCEMLDSHLVGQHTILPYGPDNTYKVVPTHPVSPRGLASDMSVVVAILPASGV